MNRCRFHLWSGLKTTIEMPGYSNQYCNKITPNWLSSSDAPGFFYLDRAFESFKMRKMYLAHGMSMLSAQGHTGHSQDLQPPNCLGNQCPGMQASQGFSNLLIMRLKLEVAGWPKKPDSLSGQWWDGNYSYSHGNTYYCFRKWSSFLQVGGWEGKVFRGSWDRKASGFPAKPTAVSEWKRFVKSHWWHVIKTHLPQAVFTIPAGHLEVLLAIR